MGHTVVGGKLVVGGGPGDPDKSVPEPFADVVNGEAVYICPSDCSYYSRLAKDMSSHIRQDQLYRQTHEVVTLNRGCYLVYGPNTLTQYLISNNLVCHPVLYQQKLS